MMAFLKEADAFFVSTEPLKQEALKRWPQKPVYVLPNCLAIGDWPEVDRLKRWQDTTRLNIGWGGSATHKMDLLQVTGIPGQVCGKMEHVSVYLFGGYKDAERMLGQGFPEGRVTDAGWVALTDLPLVVSNIDIGLAPLDGHTFNQSKSDLKALEYGACSTPTIATDSVTYRAFVRDGENGFLCKTVRDWLRAIEVLATDHPKRLEMGARARKDAVARDIDNYVHLWEEAIADVVARGAKPLGKPIARVPAPV